MAYAHGRRVAADRARPAHQLKPRAAAVERKEIRAQPRQGVVIHIVRQCVEIILEELTHALQVLAIKRNMTNPHNQQWYLKSNNACMVIQYADIE